tara:strand:- start:49 stop:1632 length:1584 start_codon:yes stop_codon:yes gene_type:complete
MGIEIQRSYKVKLAATQLIFILFINFFYIQNSFSGEIIDFSVVIKDSGEEKRFLTNKEVIPLNNEIQLQIYSKEAGILEIYYQSEATERASLLIEAIKVDVGDLIILPSNDSYFPMNLKQGNVQFEFGFIGESEKIIKTFDFFAHNLETKDFSNSNSKPVSSYSYNVNYINQLDSNKSLVSFFEKTKNEANKNISNLTIGKLRGFENVFQETVKATVLIFSNSENKDIESGMGSGVVLKDGTIITNLHVIEGNNEIIIYPYDGIIDNSGSYVGYTANILKVAKDKDLALLSINEPIKDYLSIAQDCNVQIASDAHAVGHPVGNYWSYTKGYVSQIRNDFEWSYDEESNFKAEVIQTQTPINPGNSGGPLVNTKSQLIGINSFTAQNSPGINFAVSCNEIKTFLKRNNDFNGWDKIEAAETKTIEAQWECFDDNNDSSDDSCLLDNDNNGTFDTFMWDENFDGIYDYFGIDDNENGTFEYTILMSHDGNNPYAKEYDVYFYDENEDGKVETIGYDYDNDYKIDKYVDA